MMSKYLLLLTIGPVQSFIEQARKTKDLHAGSFLLSHLTRIASRSIPAPEDIIFPNMENNFLPNRFLALIDASTDLEIEKIARKAEKGVKEEIKRIKKEVLPERIKREIGVDEQIENHFSISWHALRYKADDDYKEIYIKLEKMLAAGKNIKTFKQLDKSETGRKCSICGERNVKIYRKNKKDSNNGTPKLFTESLLILENDQSPGGLDTKQIKGSEGLCALCLLKRSLEKGKIEGYRDDSKSTADVALLEPLRILGENFNLGRYEPQALFSLKDKKDISDFEGIDETSHKNTKELFDQLKKEKIDIHPYYALLRFDGDSMGEWLSGELIKEGSLYDFHKELSKSLGNFAKLAATEVNKGGKTIYAGGDDFIGFLNLTRLIPTLNELYELFKEKVNTPLNKYFKKEGDKLTLSAGIVIAHIKNPLSEVLHWSNKMEHMAKGIDEKKNAFGLAVLKHSGEIEHARFKWKTEDTFTLDIMKVIAEERNADRLSNTFIKTLKKEFSTLTNIDEKYNNSQHIVKKELARLISRSCMRGKGEKEDDFKTRKKNIMNTLNLENLLIDSPALKDFLSFLNIADFLARQTKLEKKDEN